MINLKTSKKDDISRDIDVKYGNTCNGLHDKINNLKRENQTLKYIIQILQNNPFIVNNLIVADDKILTLLIKTLTGADDIQIDAEDIGEGCITKNKYRKVHSIYVIKDNDTKNLKYDYPQITKQFLDLKISLKLVF